MSETKAEYFVTGYGAAWNDPEPEPACEWTHERTLAVDGYSTSCEQVWYLGGMIYDSSLFKYCPFCGKPIRVTE